MMPCTVSLTSMVSHSSPFVVAGPVRRPVDPLSLVVHYSVVAPSATHATAALVLERCVVERIDAVAAETTSVPLPGEHRAQAAQVLAAAGERVLADLATVRVSSDCSVADQFVPQARTLRGCKPGAEAFRDGAAVPGHASSLPRILASLTSRLCWVTEQNARPGLVLSRHEARQAQTPNMHRDRQRVGHRLSTHRSCSDLLVFPVCVF